MGQPGWPPDWPSRSGPAACDEHRLADLVDELDLDRLGYAALCAEAKNLVDSPAIADLASMIEMFLAKGCVLRESHLATFYKAVCPPRSSLLAKFDTAATGMQRKSFATTADADSAGQFEALVAVFNNIDRGGDRIMPGAFTKTLAAWRASGDPVPVIWSHDWATPDAHIGVAYAKHMKQTARGLLVKGQLDIDDNDIARRVHKLMARRSLKEFSFGYDIPPGGRRKASDGANELIEIDLHEVGPTLKGMNPDTELHGVKSLTQTAIDDDYAAIRNRARDEMYALLTHDSGEAGTLEERFDREQARKQQRELRRQSDRIRLKQALGWDSDLIARYLRDD
jgi:HK97 family phage prohead protease